MKTCIITATNDSLTTSASEATVASESNVKARNARFHRKSVAQVDTIPPDPKQMKPLPAGLPLTAKPIMMEKDYWQKGVFRIEKNDFARQLDSISGINDSTLVGIKPSGVAGDPVPYQFRNDSLVTIVLMVSFFLIAWVISRSRYYLNEQIKEFFHHRKRENLFSQRTQNELRGQIFLVFQTCFMLGILFFDYTQEYQQQVFNQVSPYKILGLSVAICTIYFLIKVAAYSFINNIFFDRRQCQQWTESYMLCTLGTGLALLPLGLLVVYFDLDLPNTAICLVCILAVDKMLLIYKCYSIFFSYRLGWVHLFLYFCTLEIAPILILFRALIYANNYLLTIN